MAIHSFCVRALIGLMFAHLCAHHVLGQGMDPNTPNVCEKVEKYKAEVQVKFKLPYIKSDYVWCPKLPLFRCKTETKMYRDSLKVELQERNRTLFTCCDGYHQAGNSCIPVCVNQCIHGQCIRPETCECQPGYGGNTCNISCPEDRWGSKCEQACKCANNSRCNPVDGRCNCLPGTWGPGCTNVCTCINGACDPITGACTCTPGYIGKNCDTPCPEGTYGPHCASHCSCNTNQTETCRNTDGLCYCKPGFDGIKCERSCMPGTYGRYCEQVCSCSSTAYYCDPIAGCVCRSSNNGQDCVEVILSQSFRSDVNSALNQNVQNQYSAWITLLLFVTLGCCFLLYRYKRRVQTLKNELYNVIYMRSGGPSNNQFDNPLYAGIDGVSTAKVQPQIVLHPTPPPAYTEFYKEKPEPCKRSFDDSKVQPSSSGMSHWQAKLDQPSTSRADPNLYTSIDEIKGNTLNKEPVYDEIGQNSSDSNENLTGKQADQSISRFDSDDSINRNIDSIAIEKRITVESKPLNDSIIPQSIQALHYDTPRPTELASPDPFGHYETLSTASTYKADSLKDSSNPWK